ncbi:hypothetical protein LTR17_013953 [Elasticomyces elasticus]|nr:hypothetical protein LTR17_013953 [Elasticomyces elasticus]
MPELQAPKKVKLIALNATTRQQPDGVYELALYSSGDVPYPHVDIDDYDLGSWVPLSSRLTLAPRSLGRAKR